jgi:hypothetical protein
MIASLLLLTQLSGAALGFDEAKSLADKHEAALSASQTEELLKSQARAAGEAFAACILAPPPEALPDFAVVMLLETDGSVARTWRNGESELAQCVEQRFAASRFFKPPHAPFFTSFVFIFDRAKAL